MEEEPNLKGATARAGVGRWLVWGVVVAGTILLLVLGPSFLDRQPRYLGKTSTQWFPYFWDCAKGPLPGAALTNGVPASFPVLWRAVGLEPPRWVEWVREFSSVLATKAANPPGMAVFDSRTETDMTFLKNCASRPFADLVVLHWGELAGFRRRDLLIRLALDSRLTPQAADVSRNLQPALFPLLTDPDKDLQFFAAASLLHAPNLPDDSLRRIAGIGVSLRSGTYRSSQFLPKLVMYHGAGAAGRRVLADALASETGVQVDRFLMPVFLLDPEQHPIGEYWKSTGDPQRDWTRRKAVGEWIDQLDTGGPEEFAPWLEGYLLRDVESREHPEEAKALNQSFDEERFRFLSGVGRRLSDTPRWESALTQGLLATSPRVRMAAGMALVRGRGKSPTVLGAAAAALLRHQDPEVMLRLFAGAKVLPPELVPLVKSLAAGESPPGWPPISSDVKEDAQALLAALRDGK